MAPEKAGFGKVGVGETKVKNGEWRKEGGGEMANTKEK
jgi:hypothetical protein